MRGASLVAQLVKILPATWETWVRSLGWEDPWIRERLPTPVFWPGEFHGLYSPWGHKESDITERLSLLFTNEGDLGSILGSRRSTEKGNGNPLQYSCLGNPMDRGAWQDDSTWGRKKSDTTKQ